MDTSNTGDFGGGAAHKIPRSGGEFAPPRGYALSGKIMLSAIVVLFTVVLLILFLHLYVRWHLLRLATRRRDRRRGRLVFAPGRRAAARGLDPDALQSLPVLAISSSTDAADKVVECAVCLSEFVEGEKVRELPLCCHRFHIECIDMWFNSHSTCPLCRSAVVPIKKLPAAADDEAAEATETMQVSLPPSDLSSSNLAGDPTAQSSSAPGDPELLIEVPARSGLEENAASPSGLKSPGGPVSALRRLLSGDLRLYIVGGSSAEADLERGEGAERPPPQV